LLERPHVHLGGGSLSPDDQHRRLRPESIGDASDRIRSPRTSGHDGHARLTGDARPGISSVRRRLLVPHVNDADALVETAVVDVNNVSSAEGENGLDTFGLQGFRHQMATTNLGHNAAPVARSLCVGTAYRN